MYIYIMYNIYTMVRELVTIEKKQVRKRGKDLKIFTTVDKETYDNFSKGTNKAIAITLERAKDIAKDMLKHMDPKKIYTVQFQYADIWRASHAFNKLSNIKFPADGITHSNENTDLYDYVYGVQIVERSSE